MGKYGARREAVTVCMYKLLWYKYERARINYYMAT